MINKLIYKKPTFKVSVFDLEDVIRASGGDQCPTGDECSGWDDSMSQGIDPYATCSLVV